MAAKGDEDGGKAKRKLDKRLSFLPERLLGRLMQFQKEGVLFAIDRDGKCLIGDEMGLGKTLQALSVAYYYRGEWPLLIVVPSSLRYPWIDEIEKWFPEIDPAHINLILAGTDTGDIASARITVVTYGLLRSPSSTVLQEALMNQHFRVVIVDESHNMKNRRSATSKYLGPLVQQAERRFLLTGTPALARPEELFPQIDAICPKKLGSWSNFAKRYCDARWQYFGRQGRRWVTDGASNLEELQSLLTSECMIRRLKKDVLTQLPPKQRQRVLFPLKESVLKKDLDLGWRELETAMGRGSVNLGSVLGGEPAEPTSTFDVHRLISSIYRKTAACKIGPVKEYVKMLCDNEGLKFIVFAHHHVMLDGISEQLHDEQIKFIRIDGNTDQQARPQLVHEFQADKNVRVAVLSIKAAGVGLTLTAAKLVVFAELDWTPGVLEQCEDRAHRIGQQDTVHIHYLVAKGTLDEWVWTALARKTAVVTTTLNGKRQVLRMDDGNRGQIQCLANADAWIPKKKSDTDEETLASFFETQQLIANKQRSIHDFFTPKGTKRKLVEADMDVGDMESPKSEKKRRGTNAAAVSCSPRAAHNGVKEGAAPSVILIDSDDDTNNFTTPKSQRIGSKSRLKPEDTDSEVNKWSCSACTFLNHEALSSCEICFTPKQVAKKTKPKNSGNSSFSGQQRENHQKQNGVQNDHSGLQIHISSTLLVADGDSNETNELNSSKIEELAMELETPHNELDLNVENASDLIFDQFDDVDTQECQSGKDIDDCDSSQDSAAPDSSKLDESATEEAAAMALFSADTQSITGPNWVCPRCECENTPADDVCDVCFGDRPNQAPSANEDVAESSSTPPSAESRHVDLDSVPVYERFQYCCSRNTSRIYLHDERGNSLDVNFLPLDVEMEVHAALPDLLLHPSNMRLVKRFLREWDSLAPTKRRVVVKAGQVFANPLMHYEDIKKGRVATSQRFMSKTDVAVAAVSQADLVSGSVRNLTRPGTVRTGAGRPPSSSPSTSNHTTTNSPKGSTPKMRKAQTEKRKTVGNKDTVGERIQLPDNEEDLDRMAGIVQALSADGTPLCITCQKPYSNKLVSEATVKQNPWETRFCSQDCAEQLWVRRHGDYAKQLVFEVEFGKCQLCQFDAQKFFERIKVTNDVTRRAELLQDSKYSVLSSDIKQQMARDPKRGQFWQADHIQAVSEGGGQCDIDNLRTLCTLCHRDVTAEQGRRRVAGRRQQRAAHCRDITAFFKKS